MGTPNDDHLCGVPITNQITCLMWAPGEILPSDWIPGCCARRTTPNLSRLRANRAAEGWGNIRGQGCTIAFALVTNGECKFIAVVPHKAVVEVSE